MSPSRLRNWALNLHTTIVRTLTTPHLHCDFTSLLGTMPWVFKRKHRTLHACGELNGTAAYARAENPPASQRRRLTLVGEGPIEAP